MPSEPDHPYLKFWGKAGGERNGEPSWHPLAYHNLDVGAVADVLLRGSPRKLDGFAKLLSMTPDNARRFLVCLIALHDIGKFSSAFQAKNREAWPAAVLGDWSAHPNVFHDELGSEMRDMLRLTSLFRATLRAWLPSEFFSLWHSVTGHHGQPRVRAANEHPVGMNGSCKDAARLFCGDVHALFANPEPATEPDQGNLAAMSWAVAGLTVIADWIGSNRAWFPYRNPDYELVDYWQYALRMAETAVASAGVLPVLVPDTMSVARLLPKIAELSPLQRHVADLTLPKGPMLALVCMLHRISTETTPADPRRPSLAASSGCVSRPWEAARSAGEKRSAGALPASLGFHCRPGMTGGCFAFWGSSRPGRSSFIVA